MRRYVSIQLVSCWNNINYLVYGCCVSVIEGVRELDWICGRMGTLWITPLGY